jgi:hypothetical protein
MTRYDQARAAAAKSIASEGSLTAHASIKLTRAHEGKPLPTGVVYIGRDHGGHARSPLANTFKVDTVGGIAPAVGLYMRWLTTRVWERDLAILAALEAIGGPRSTLACWCCERPAELLWTGPTLPAKPCHGDVVASMHEALLDEGVLEDRSRLGQTTFTKSALLLFARAFGSHRVIRSRTARAKTEAWLTSQGRTLEQKPIADATCVIAAECCNGGGCSRCGGTGFESTRFEIEGDP